MRKYSYIPITCDDIREAIESASKDKRRRKDVRKVLENMDTYIKELKQHIEDGTWKSLIKFTQSEKTGNNGKKRKLDTPNFDTLILEHIFINKVMPIYKKHDPLVSLNCKKGCGIVAPKKENVKKKNYVLPRVKHLFYDLREYEWLVSADQRKCYEHIKPSVFRKELKKIISDREMIEFAMGVCFNDGKLPIGAPSSSLVHHIIMLDFHRWLCRNSGWRLCYADNCIAAFETKEEAQQMKWRIKQYWWYELKLRAKRSETRVLSISDARGFDFCGYRVFRNKLNLKQKMNGITQRNKGYCQPRKTILKRASECRKNTSWSSYFGLLRNSDSYRKMVKIESSMKLKDLTSKIKIDRTMDAKNIKASELAKSGQLFTIYDYEIRNSEKTGKPNWIKCLIGIPEKDNNGELTGKTKAYEFHGGMMSIVEYMKKVEDAFGKKNLLPIEEVAISDQCGYIFANSTNQKEYIE